MRGPWAGPNYGRVSRAALLAGASAFALAAFGASGVARAACVPSPQIIAAPTSGPISSNGGAITRGHHHHRITTGVPVLHPRAV